MSKSLNIRGTPPEVFDAIDTVSGITLGTRMHLPNGRVFRRCKNGPTALVAGRLVQMAEQVHQFENKNIGALVYAGSSIITVVIEETVDIQANELEDALMVVNDDQGEGYLYHVEGSDAYTVSPASGAPLDTGALTIKLATVLQTDLTTSSQVTIVKNVYQGARLALTPPSEAVLGVAPTAVPANMYFWLQTYGPCAVLQDGELYNYRPVMASVNVKGAVETARVVLPADTQAADWSETPRQAFVGEEIVDTLGPDGVGVRTSIGEVSGRGILPPVQVGYTINARADTEYALVHLTILN